eukprot:scaffold4940_cov46-Attheya_sp.AAC.2
MSASPMLRTLVSPDDQPYQHRHIIEQQQAEIDALHAKLSLGYSTPQQHADPKEDHDDYEPVMELIDECPVEHIGCVHLTERQDQPTDDLTVWS